MTVHIKNQKIREAIELIKERSGDEKRKLSPDPENEPYWHHLVRVYYLLEQKGETDSPLLLAAILHDSIEDGHATAEKLSLDFGDEVSEIVQLLSEQEHTDHSTNTDRTSYFQKIDNYPNRSIRAKALKIKVADRYDNLIGLSFTTLEQKKEQYKRESEQFFRRFAQEVGMQDFLNLAEAVLDGELEAPDLSLTISI